MTCLVSLERHQYQTYTMRRFTLGFLCGCMVTFLFGLYIWYCPPLIRVPQWSASYTTSGTSHSDGDVYRTFFPSSIYFVHLPQAAETDRWFAFSQSNQIVGQPGNPYRTLFGYSTHRNPGVGIRLGDPKLEREWQVDYSDHLPSFSTATLSVKITSNDSNQVAANKL